MSKEVKFGLESRSLIESGMDILASAVRVTLGPKGRNVILDRTYGAPLITNDGVTIAKEIDLDNRYENLGASLLKEVAIKTNDVAGDGTTTATILAHEMVKEGLKNITAGANPMILKEGISEATELVVDELKSMSVDVSSSEDISQVASISSGDVEVGRLISEAMDKVGNDGVITVEKSNSTETTLDVVEGMQIDKGYLSPYMATSTESMVAELDDPYILVTDKTITSIQDILHILESVMESGKPLLIIAEGIEEEPLSTLVLNKMRGTFNVVAIKAPSHGDNRVRILEDIAVLTGTNVVKSELGDTFSTVRLDDLGSIKKVVVSEEETILTEDVSKVKSQLLEDRVNQIKKSIELSESEFDKNRLRNRLAKLSGGVAVIQVGSFSEVEMIEKKERIEDALSATKAAVEEGIVPGGGSAFIDTLSTLSDYIETLDGDKKVGAELVSKALKEPLKQLADNSGDSEGLVVVSEVIRMDKGVGYDSLNDRYVNMMKEGIVDPTKVTRSALENASSIAGMVLTTEASIVIVDNLE